MRHFDVMISSTIEDLQPHRLVARQICLDLDAFPKMMEHRPSSDDEAVAVSLGLVNEAEIYVGIFGWRYGHIPNGYNLALTEMEYNRAMELGIPRLIFICHEDHLVKKSVIEGGIAESKLEDLKNKLKKQNFVKFFKSPEEFGTQLGMSLAREMLKYEDIGSAKIKMLHPPTPLVNQPFRNKTKRFIGREKELSEISKWISGPVDRSIYSLIGIQGIGKSAMAWEWFTKYLPSEASGIEGYIWWSFRGEFRSFDQFLRYALAYTSKRSIESLGTINSEEIFNRLQDELNKKCFVIVMDGLECLLEQANDPRMMPRRIWKPEKTRFEIVAKFLSANLRLSKSRILLTSRILPLDLHVSIDSRELESGQFLSGLDESDAYTLWRQLRAPGNRKEVLQYINGLGNSPSLIQTVAFHFRSAAAINEWTEVYPNMSSLDRDV